MGLKHQKLLVLKGVRLSDEPFLAVVLIKTIFQFKGIFSRVKTIVLSNINEKNTQLS